MIFVSIFFVQLLGSKYAPGEVMDAASGGPGEVGRDNRNGWKNGKRWDKMMEFKADGKICWKTDGQNDGGSTLEVCFS